MKIEKAIDWDKVSVQLHAQMSQAGYNPDLNRMLLNITKMVTELSKLEVGFRRIHKSNMTDDKVNEINKAINHLEKLILMASLMK
jgi:hypothetical protein